MKNKFLYTVLSASFLATASAIFASDYESAGSDSENSLSTPLALCITAVPAEAEEAKAPSKGNSLQDDFSNAKNKIVALQKILEDLVPNIASAKPAADASKALTELSQIFTDLSAKVSQEFLDILGNEKIKREAKESALQKQLDEQSQEIGSLQRGFLEIGQRLAAEIQQRQKNDEAQRVGLHREAEQRRHHDQQQRAHDQQQDTSLVALRTACEKKKGGGADGGCRIM